MSEGKQVIRKITISIDEKLWQEFDAARIRAGYGTRSAAVAEAVRQLIERERKRRS